MENKDKRYGKLMLALALGFSLAAEATDYILKNNAEEKQTSMRKELSIAGDAKVKAPQGELAGALKN